MDMPGSSVHGIFQARILEWVAFSFSQDALQPRDRTRVSCVSCTGSWISFLPLSQLGSPNSQIIFTFLLPKMYKFSKVYTIGVFSLNSVFLVNEFYLQIN